MYFGLENTNDDDDWFYESINSYRVLQMYDIQMKPYHMVKASDDCLCLAGIHLASGRTEILCITMPPKLMLPEGERDRSKGNDFDIRSGGFLEEHVTSLGVIPGVEKAVASFKDTIGLTLLDIGIERTSITKAEVLHSDGDVTAPNFSINPSTPELVVTKSSSDPLTCLDCITSRGKDIDLPPSLTSHEAEIFSCYCGTDEVVLLNAKTGSVATVDIRSETVTALNSENDDRDGAFVLTADEGNGVATLCRDGTVCLYDKRNPVHFLARKKIDTPRACDSKLKIQLGSSDRISISGFDNCVSVFEVFGNDMTEVFTHHGHSKLDARPCSNVTDHLWMPHIASNFLVSCAENGTLNCWEYVRK